MSAVAEYAHSIGATVAISENAKLPVLAPPVVGKC